MERERQRCRWEGRGVQVGSIQEQAGFREGYGQTKQCIRKGLLGNESFSEAILEFLGSTRAGIIADPSKRNRAISHPALAPSTRLDPCLTPCFFSEHFIQLALPITWFRILRH